MKITLHDLCGYIAGFLMIVGMVPYVYSIVSTKETKLNRSSWIIWSAMGLINLAAYWAAGERETIWFVLLSALNPLLILLLSFKFGIVEWTRSETVCFTLAILALILWKWTSDPAFAVGCSITADALAIYPVFRKICRQPNTENLAGWMIGLCASVFNILAVKQWTVVNGIYTIYSVVGFGLVTCTILYVRSVHKSTSK